MKARYNQPVAPSLLRTCALSLAVVAVVAGCGGAARSKVTVSAAPGSGLTGTGRALLTQYETRGFSAGQVVGAHTAAAWVRLERAANAASERELLSDRFVNGLSEVLNGAATTGTSAAAQFAAPAGARDLLERQISALGKSAEPALRPQRFTVAGIPDAAGFAFTTPPNPHTEVVFSQRDYYVEITTSGIGDAASLSSAARSIYHRLAD